MNSLQETEYTECGLRTGKRVYRIWIAGNSVVFSGVTQEKSAHNVKCRQRTGNKAYGMWTVYRKESVQNLDCWKQCSVQWRDSGKECTQCEMWTAYRKQRVQNVNCVQEAECTECGLRTGNRGLLLLVGVLNPANH